MTPEQASAGQTSFPSTQVVSAHQLYLAVPRTAYVGLSVVVPVYDEEDNLTELCERVAAALAGQDWELILVDDGSRDGSLECIRELSRSNPRVLGVRLSRNQGQSAAICAGLQVASGALIATLDADLQNDPADLLLLLAELGDWDAVVGRRKQRRDSWIRRVSSRVANGIRNTVTRDHVADTGCSLKLFRREAILSVPFFTGAHRFLPTLLRYMGFRVTEVEVEHHPRVAGQSKYGIWNRALPAMFDMFAVCWMRNRLIRLPVSAVITSGLPQPLPDHRDGAEERPLSCAPPSVV